KASSREKYRLEHIGANIFKKRLRELSEEFNGTSSFKADKLYLRKTKSPFELEVTEENGIVLLESSMLWGHKFIIVLMTMMFIMFIIFGLSLSGLQAVAYLGFIGYLLITFISNSEINKISEEYFKLIKSLDYDLSK
ncbi:MAG: hypothetical protein RIB63_09760, partial [Fulvivirga sp.]